MARTVSKKKASHKEYLRAQFFILNCWKLKVVNEGLIVVCVVGRVVRRMEWFVCVCDSMAE